VSEHNDTALALLATRRASFTRRPSPGLTHHSDRGSPYASADHTEALHQFEKVRSMSKKGDCWDNAVAESFFSTPAFECVRGVSFESHSTLAASLARPLNGGDLSCGRTLTRSDGGHFGRLVGWFVCGWWSVTPCMSAWFLVWLNFLEAWGQIRSRRRFGVGASRSSVAPRCHRTTLPPPPPSTQNF
jgi:hypothetical protein